MKKNYTKPEFEMVRIMPVSFLASSTETKAETEKLTDDDDFNWGTQPTQNDL